MSTLDINDFYEIPIKQDRIAHLKHATKLIKEYGYVLEFGVYKGQTLRTLANSMAPRHVWGFDSFEGLPEDWIRTEKDVYKKGHFKTLLPKVPKNVTLVKGFFDYSLPNWLRNRDGNIALLHIDCDLYSSTVTVLDELNSKIIPETIIVFDELCNWSKSSVYKFWEDGEWKALCEWAEKFDREIEPISRTKQFQASIKVIK